MARLVMERQTKWISKRQAEIIMKRWQKRFPRKHLFQIKQKGSKFAVFASRVVN